MYVRLKRTEICQRIAKLTKRQLLCVSTLVVFFIVTAVVKREALRELFTPAEVYVTPTCTLPLRLRYAGAERGITLCPCVSPLLVGTLLPNVTTPATWGEVGRGVRDVSPGGIHSPQGCMARESLVVVIPCRNRESHLRLLLRHLHPFLQRQQASYAILVLEEMASAQYNKAMSLNIGYLEAVKRWNPDCVIFHDVDQLPEDDRNTYRCEKSPLHLNVQPSQYDYKLRYRGLIGGALAMTQEQMVTVNGYSNSYFGWGNEDNDMYLRLNTVGLPIVRHLPNLCNYTSLVHTRDEENIMDGFNQRIIKARRRSWSHDFLNEGLSSLQYDVTEVKEYLLYTHIRAKAVTPLSAYSHVTRQIPCAQDHVTRISLSLDACALECTNMAAECVGFVYDFTHPPPKYTCFPKTRTCQETERINNHKFFLKDIG